MPLSRYDRIDTVSTPLDPLAAALNWIRGLRSVGLCSDLLKERHGFVGSTVTTDAARAMAAHAEVAVALIEQALSGPAHVSYIAAYYGLLDLAKIVIVASGGLAELQKEKWHGMSWSGIQTAVQDLQTDHITLQGRGAGALFYKALTGKRWTTPNRKSRRLAMRDVYPYIQCVSFEYAQVYGVQRLAPLASEFQPTGKNVGRARLTFYGQPSPATHGRNHFKLLAGLKKESDTTYVSELVTGSSSDELLLRAAQRIQRRYLLYPHAGRAPLGGFAPRVSSTLPMQPTVDFAAFLTPVSMGVRVSGILDHSDRLRA